MERNLWGHALRSSIASTLANPGAAANKAESEKFAHYLDTMNRYDFRSVGFVTLNQLEKKQSIFYFLLANFCLARWAGGVVGLIYGNVWVLQ